MTGYCSTCKKITEMKDIKKEKLKNLQMVYIGKCINCDSEIYKTITKEE